METLEDQLLAQLPDPVPMSHELYRAFWRLLHAARNTAYGLGRIAGPELTESIAVISRIVQAKKPAGRP